jgi:hypothetical protein
MVEIDKGEDPNVDWWKQLLDRVSNVGKTTRYQREIIIDFQMDIEPSRTVASDVTLRNGNIVKANIRLPAISGHFSDRMETRNRMASAMGNIDDTVGYTIDTPMAGIDTVPHLRVSASDVTMEEFVDWLSQVEEAYKEEFEKVERTEAR